MQEIFKDIKGYEGLYQLSNLGRIKSTIHAKEKFLKVQNQEYEFYPYYTLYKGNGKKNFRIHRLVALHFMPNPFNKPCINHIDGNKNNYSLDNLEWVTHSENTKHAFKIGSMSHVGEKHSRTKLKDADILEIRNLDKTTNYTTKELARKYKITGATIRKIITRETWRHI